MCSAALVVFLSLPVCAQGDSPRASILEGVDVVTAPGCLLGQLCVYGDEAFPLLTGAAGGARSIVLAGASYEEGRVLVAAHDGLLQGPQDQPGNARFAANAVRWLSDGKPQAVVGLRGFGGLRPTLEAAGFTVVALSDGDWRGRLGELDVLVTGGYDLGGPEGVEAVRGFVAGGGGVMTGVCPWGWLQVQGKPASALATDLDGNRLLAPMGLVYTDATSDETGKGGFLADETGLALGHARAALEALRGHADATAPLDGASLAQVGVTLTSAIRALPREDTAFLPTLRQTCADLGGDRWPTPSTPVSAKDPVARLAVALFLADAEGRTAEETVACPAAEGFPGSVPSEAPRVTRSVSIDTGIPEWHGTGLYAAPGEVLTVRIPESAAKLGLALRIGCHTDGIWHHDEWKRMPEISSLSPLARPETTVASAMGGLVYVVVPWNAARSEVAVEIAGAVEAPRYVAGVTDLDEWRDQIRNAPAPWGELETSRVVLSLPAEVFRTLDDPDEVARFWDDTLDACADLAAIPRERPRPERYVSDIQISAGYMHSGYPIMTWLDVPPFFVDSKRLRTEGNWGAFHEMGHNHQEGEWTFDGTVEVTENLFSVYCGEQVCGFTDAGQGHPAMREPGKSERLRKYLSEGARFEAWQSDPFLALTMYEQLWQTFGWEAYKEVFAEYRTLSREERPRTELQKRDQWMVRLSRTVGRNLGPFFEAWGVPTSEAARESIGDLPEWMPEDWPA